MLLDFQNFNFKLYSAENYFEQQVLDFIKHWFSEEENVCVKTSGSTGTPKIIQVEKEKMRNSAKMTCDFLDLKKGDSAILCLPVEYISGKMMVVRAIERKLILHIANTSLQPLKNFNGEVHFCAMTPLQVENSINKVAKINKLIIGGAKVSNDLKDKIQKRLLLDKAKTQVYETYGMSETLSHIALRTIAPVEEAYFKVFDDIEISVDAQNCLKIFAPALNSEILQTNDIIELKNTDQFKFIGRADFIINSGGLKISPEVLEKLVKGKVDSELIFVGIPDSLLGEKLVLVIEGKADKSILDKIDATAFPTKNHRPKKIFFLESFPRTETGKILRQEVRKSLEKL